MSASRVFRCLARRRSRSWRAWHSLCGVLGLLGCGASEAPSPRTLELFSWWVSPGEQSALDALVARFEVLHPDTTVQRTTANSAAAARVQIQDRMNARAAPDTFQTVGGWDALRWVTQTGQDASLSALSPLNDVADSVGLLAKLPAVVRSALSFDGSLYAIPLDVPRTNVLFYNKQVFLNNQLTPPRTLVEFYAVAELLKAKGISPLSIGARDGSTISQLLFDSVLLASAGSTFRNSYLTGGEDPSDARLTQALTEVTRLLSYSNSNRDAVDWTSAARAVIDGSAAMTFVGDWAGAFFESAGQKPDVDFGVVPFPGTNQLFVYLIDSFVLPIGSANRAAATDFLRFVGSQEATNLFAPLKGTVPARVDVDVSRLNPLTLGSRAAFSSSELVRGHVSLIASTDFLVQLDSSMRNYSSDGDQAAVLNLLRSRYDQL